MARKRNSRATAGTGAADDVARLAVAEVFLLVLTGTAGAVLAWPGLA